MTRTEHYQSTAVKLEIPAEQIELLIVGMAELADAMQREAFQYTSSGVFVDDKSLTRGENAEAWIQEHYDTAAGAFRLIAAAGSIISTAVINDDLQITNG